MKLKDWKEPLAAAGVILSLLFVAYEVRQNTKVARAQTRHALAELNQEWLTLHSQDPEFNRVWNKLWVAPADLTESEGRRGAMMMTMHLRRLENVYFQHREGLIDASALNSYGLQTVATDFDSEFFRSYWFEYNWREGFDPEFVEFFESRAGL